jgi:multiple sugar transport system ATP-binding protein
MDEPLSNLDAKLRVQMRAEIARLQRSLGVPPSTSPTTRPRAMTLGSRVGGYPARGTAAGGAAAGALPAPGQPLRGLVHRLTGHEPDRGERGRGDGGPQVCFGPHRFAIGEKGGPGTPRPWSANLGRKVVLGIRPEHLEDASLARDAAPGSVIEVTVELREELGSEVDLHCAVGVAPLHPAGLVGR